MKDEMLTLILRVAKEFNEQEDEKRIPVEDGEYAALYGLGGSLDSLGLVSFIVAIEQEIEDQLGFTITLADARAMSQNRSPFSTIGSLRDYLAILVGECS